MPRDDKGRFVAGKREEVRGANNPAWKGGRRVSSYGYVMVSVGDGKYTPEHRLLMEAHLGRLLEKDEQVHHVNGDKTDNRIANLELLDAATHTQRHHGTRTYEEHPCAICGTPVRRPWWRFKSPHRIVCSKECMATNLSVNIKPWVGRYGPKVADS